MKNIDFIEQHKNIPGMAELFEKACIDNKKYGEWCDFVVSILTTETQWNRYPNNEVCEEVMFDYADIFFFWWLEEEYDEWYERAKEKTEEK